jgi:HAD superfamily hydrolase (TIGR01509 family)
MPSAAYDLVIFDCDGVLVDSELLSAKVLTAQLAGLGIDLSFAEFQNYFLGRKFSVAVAALKQRTQKQLPDNFQDNYFERLLHLFETDLQPIAGVKDVLKAMRVTYCVASSSLPPRLTCALRVCGLQSFFGPNVYSTGLVKNAKPAPDLFLYAAQAHGVASERCLVIEDSELGIKAAQAAGMDVWHFTGGAHLSGMPETSMNFGASRVVKDMQILHQLFCENGLSQSDGFVRGEIESHGT